MNTAPPASAAIDSRVEMIRADVDRRIRRRSRAVRASLTAALAAGCALGGAGIATANYPSTVAMQGVVKTQYVDAFVECSEDAGVETVILTGEASRSVIEGWPLADGTEYSAIESRMDSANQGAFGRALSACQQELATRFGEPIL